MRKIILPLSIAICAVIACCFTACSSQTNGTVQSEVTSNIAGTTESIVSGAQSIVSSYVLSSDYKEWTYNDWVMATDEQKENCRLFFSEQLSKDVSTENLNKIFGTNQDKKLSEIIKIQQEAIAETSSNSSTSSVQSDPGHGAAAGFE